jgi:hypothetical protein
VLAADFSEDGGRICARHLCLSEIAMAQDTSITSHPVAVSSQPNGKLQRRLPFPLGFPTAIGRYMIRRRWPWFVLAGLALLISFPAATYWYVKWSSENDMVSVIAETDRLDPAWRLEDIEAQREILKPEENSALFVTTVRGLIGSSSILHRNENYQLFDNMEAPYQLNARQLELLRQAYAEKEEALQECRKLKDMPKGRFPITFSADFINTLLPNQQNARSVFHVMQHDAWLRAQDGDLDGAVESCRAAMNAARSIGDEPTLISFLIRVAGDHVAISALERTLAQGQPSEQALKPMQALLAREIADAEKHWLNGLRGERGGGQRIVQAINDGKLKAGALTGSGWRGGSPNFEERVLDHFPALVTRENPALLRHMNEVVETAKLPIEDCSEKLRDLEKSISKNSILVRLLVPALQKVSMANQRNQALLRSALVAVAAERFRLKHQRWPQTLAELETASLLSPTPADPYDGAPLRWRPWPDGRIAYSVGTDKIDNGGNLDLRHYLDAGYDIGFKLWDVPRRRQPPRPVQLDDDANR